MKRIKKQVIAARLNIPYKGLFFLAYLIFALQQGYCQQHPGIINIAVPFVSSSTIISGKPVIYYELHVTNTAKDTLVLAKLDVIRPNDSKVVLSIDQNKLTDRFKRIDQPEKSTKAILPPGASAVIYMEVNLPGKSANLFLSHRLYTEVLNGDTKTPVLLKGGEIKLKKQKPLVIGPPLKAGPWVAIYDAAWPNGHRRVFYTVNDSARLPGRFAIDFIKLDRKGSYASGSEDLIKNWYGYNADVLAVSDGVVASVKNDFEQSPSLSAYKTTTAENAKGNYISLKIGEHKYVFYEHLKPGSIRVKPGQKIKKGDVIASLGFTGQTTGPHLHLHIANENSPLGAEGIPFEFKQFILLGGYPDLSNFGKESWAPVPSIINITKEHPAPNSVIKFNN